MATFETLRDHFNSRFGINAVDFHNPGVLNLRDFIEVYFAFLIKSKSHIQAVFEAVVFEKLKSLIEEETKVSPLLMTTPIEEFLPVNTRLLVYDRISQKSPYKLPRLVIPVVGFIILCLSFIGGFVLFFFLAFKVAGLFPAFPQAFQIGIAFVIGVLPVILLRKMFPSLFMENHFYYVKTFGDFVRQVLQDNEAVFHKDKKLLLGGIDEYIRKDVSILSDLPIEMVDSVLLDNLSPKLAVNR